MAKVADDIELVFMPSSDDLASFYPIPQPKYELEEYISNIHLTSNPGHLTLKGGVKNIRIDMVNTDILSYIDEHKTGIPTRPVMQENIETYFKQPFLLTNTLDEPFKL